MGLGGGISRSLQGFFLVSGGKVGGGIEFFFLGEKGDLLYIGRGGG